MSDAPKDVQLWPIGNVRPYAKNAKKHDDAAVDEAVASLTEFGWTYPLLVDENGELLSGHRRLLAARRMGMERVPVLQKLGLSDTGKKAYRLLDNKMQERTPWDVDLVRFELDDLMAAGVNLGLTGFDEADLIELVKASQAKLAPPTNQRKLNDRAKAIKVVLFADELADFEAALKLTGIKNRGEALLCVCQEYLRNNHEKRQFDDHVKGLAAV